MAILDLPSSIFSWRFCWSLASEIHKLRQKVNGVYRMMREGRR
jgi:hypothetical protein